MSDSGDWKYLPVLNAGIQILLTVGLGVLLAALNIVSESHGDALVTFVFHIALPCLVVRGIGIGVDFYSDNFIWEYIGAFLILRAVSLLLAIIVGAVIKPRLCTKIITKDAVKSSAITHVAVEWLSYTWISTVILGIPILTAIYDSPQQGQFFGLLAGISSFIFQLPLMLCMFEISAIRDSREDIDVENATNRLEYDEIVTATSVQQENHHVFDKKTIESWPTVKRILLRMAKNPVLQGICAGLLISLSTFGSVYLHPLSDKYEEGLAWLEGTLNWFGSTVSPLSLFSMGIWMYHRYKKNGFKSISYVGLSINMFVKLFLVPVLMIGIAKMLSLDDISGRAAILIASLPISQASFSLGKQYGVGEDALAANVAVGTILMLPAVICWAAAMDSAGLYEIQP